MMISEKEAWAIAQKYIEEQCRAIHGGVVIIEERTIRKPYGWIFFYNSKIYMETRNPLEALGGNGPLVVERADGRVYQLGSAHAPDTMIAEFERARGFQ